MKGRIFTAQEVQAIIAGNKKMFREVIKPQPEEKLKDYFYSLGETTGYCESLFILDKCPYQVGQKIFVKESFFSGWKNKVVMYATEGNPLLYGRKRPAQHMRQEHSRIILQIKEVKVEKENNLWVWVINFEVI